MSSGSRWLSAFALAVAILLAGHRLVPAEGIGTLLDSVLLWSGLIILVLIVVALFPGRRPVLAVLAVPLVIWLIMFGPMVWPKQGSGTAELRVISQNLDAANPDPCGALRELGRDSADLIAVEELTGRSEGCDMDLPHQVRKGTVALWSRFPITGSTPLELGLGWPRALRATVTTPRGAITVYVVHLPSARPGATVDRDAGLRALAGLLAAEPPGPVLVAGDFNTASTDRAFDLFTGYRNAQREAGTGFGFTWPAAFPVTRPDHLLSRGLTAVYSDTLPARGSDHLGIAAGFISRAATGN
ncbi:hypothetical protein D5S17_08045 [Pseudonocardiaceae bacterium YIM PH 21723]|nr:hypothetical protein D5S17_08045 [Pseudonocardiaceae bacterium YIM PH 21723]